MFTARAMTSTATTSETASSAIIISLAQGRIGETSVGLKAIAAENARCRRTAASALTAVIRPISDPAVAQGRGQHRAQDRAEGAAQSAASG